MTTASRPPRFGRLFAFVLLTGVSLGAVACGQPPAAGAAEPAAAPAAAAASATDAVTLSEEQMRAGGIAVGAPRLESRAAELTASAVLQLDETRTARLGSIVEGVVVDAPVMAGSRVRKGARIASIHSHMVHEAWAEYRRALAERRRASTQLTFQKEAEARAARLLLTKAASRQEAERAQTERASAEEALVIAESEVTRALEELEHLGLSPDDADTSDATDTVPVLATIGGVVLERLVTGGTAVTTGTPLFVISDLSRLWAVAEIDEGRLPAVAVGRDAALTVAAYPDRAFQGRVIAIGDTVNPETRRVLARIDVANADGSLKPQMFATIRLATGETERVLLVPGEAVQKLNQGAVVFVEERPGRFVPRQVQTGQERDGHIEIRAGLDAGDRIATAGAFLLKSRVLETGTPE